MNLHTDLVPASEARQVLLAGMTEKELLADVVSRCRDYGLPVYHVLDVLHHAKVIGPGFPDLVIAIPPDLYLVELKSSKGQLSPEQQAWQDILGKCRNVRSGIIRPRDIDRLDELLRATRDGN